MRSVVPVDERVAETPSTATLRFDYPPTAEPGQFVMVWLPGDDELPMSLSYVEGPQKGITVKAMGESSARLVRLRPPDRLGVRGPYGRGFDLSPRRILVVGGGSGAAVLAPAAEAAARAGALVDVALGATTREELLFYERFRAMGARLFPATDDGSFGYRGYVSDVARERLGSESYQAVWTCGPELMMRKVLEEAERRSVASFGSVERVMKCALGMCDACALGPFHVCRDGPVLPGRRLLDLEEFGRAFRNASGRLTPFEVRRAPSGRTGRDRGPGR